jgi:hypothetical protein
MESLHPDLYHGMPTAEMAEGARSLVERLQSSSDDEILVGLMGLAALVSARGRDGHMGIWPPENPGVVHRYPIRLWEFPDGLHVTAARAPNERLVGSRMVAIDGVPIGEVLRRLDPVVPRDNGSGLRASRTVYLTSAEVLAGLGIARRADRIRVEVADATGRMETATIVAVSGSDFAAWVSGWELALPRRGDMLLLRDPTADHWTRYLESARAHSTCSTTRSCREARTSSRRSGRTYRAMTSNGSSSICGTTAGERPRATVSFWTSSPVGSAIFPAAWSS